MGIVSNVSMSVWPEDLEIGLSKNALEPNDAVGD